VPFSFDDGGRTIEGRIDVLADEAEGLLVVDFKTDQVPPGHESELAARYAAQLRAYAAAVHAATGKSVRSAQLVFLRTLACIDVPLV
jgi:ATP-dependent helicase/nuclease subunit A